MAAAAATDAQPSYDTPPGAVSLRTIISLPAVPGPLLFQAHFHQRGKREAVDFISQHPVLVASLVKIAVLLFIVMTALAYLTWFERKVVARIQSRWGPYYVGAHGLLQPLADGLKFLFKEDITPPASDRFLYLLAPFLALR